ncbi:hypothetical protein [Candidatus Borreliella tachyglossi]|uniref:hypothetical protein n=1 Tax=Candidatus Borreliella tachyglossi TaxID=1964448 RepID=UPI0040429EE9
MEIFKIFSSNKIVKLETTDVGLERDIQKIFESNLETFFNVKFIDTEFKIENKRIDTIGIIDGSFIVPVILEYKKDSSPMHVLQAARYDEILKDRKSDFLIAVMNKFGKNSEKYNNKDNIDFNSTKIICVAKSFTEEAKLQAKRDSSEILLVEYDLYEDNLMTLKITTYPAIGGNGKSVVKDKKNKSEVKTEIMQNIIFKRDDDNSLLTENLKMLDRASVELKNLNKVLEDFILTLGSVEKYEAKYYTGFKVSGGKVFVDIEFRPGKGVMVITIKLPLEKVDLKEGFVRDVSNIGTRGNGNIEIIFGDISQFEEVKTLIQLSYDNVL